MRGIKIAKRKTTLAFVATYEEKIKANEIVDAFLYKMKGNGLLGNLTIKEAKEIINGNYIKKYGINMLKIIGKNREINAFCFVFAKGISILIAYPSNLIFWLAAYAFRHNDLLHLIALLFILSTYFPHPTSIGLWLVIGSPVGGAKMSSIGLFGRKEERGSVIIAITIGFTGLYLFNYAIGSCLLLFSGVH